MRPAFMLLSLVLVGFPVLATLSTTRLTAAEETMPDHVLDVTMDDIDGKPYDLRQHAGKVVMFVNVASQCGNTPQYAALEALNQKYRDQGLVIIGVPANDFGAQEPGSNTEIKQFCDSRYHVTFPMLAKVHVKGPEICPLYKRLTSDRVQPGEVTWNFAKFLVGRDGRLVDRFDPKTKPDDATLVKSVEAALAQQAPAPTTGTAPALAFTMQDIEGKPYPLAQHLGKVVLLVNVASKCGLTPQYAALESLYEKYRDRGLVVIGIPANEFGAQEPGTNAEIKQFCTSTFNVSFPMLAKVSVKGPDICPLYAYLTTKSPKPGEIAWNFAKFLVGRDGRVIDRFDPQTTPEDAKVSAAVEQALGPAAQAAK